MASVTLAVKLPPSPAPPDLTDGWVHISVHCNRVEWAALPCEREREQYGFIGNQQ